MGDKDNMNNSPKTRSQKRLRSENENDENKKKKKDDKDNKDEKPKKRIPLITINPFPLDKHVNNKTLYPSDDEDDDFIVDDDEDVDEDESEDDEYDSEDDEDDDESEDESDDDENEDERRKRESKLTDIELKKAEKYNNEEFDYYKSLNKNDRQLVIRKQNEVEGFCKKDIPFRFEILKSNMPLHMKSCILDKLNQLSQMKGYESDYFKLTKWVNGISKMPFMNYIELPFNTNQPVDDLLKNEDALNFLKNANKIMKNSTYGHEMAKDRVVQVITKWISNPKGKGNVIAFQGPPGIGKTSLARNGIAKAINRPFCFMTLGGATDASFLEGFSFTYEGSEWGKISQMLMDAKCMNPVIYMDELDKISNTDKGNEIAGLLTHITDASQNEEFEDRYFSGVKIDLSKALFIFSYNDASLINPILKDRITEISLSGYNKDDKITIARDYSIPELLESVGFKSGDIEFSDEIIGYIIDNYTNEEGVRSLRRCIETILMKLNVYRFLKDDEYINYHIDNFSIPFSINKNIVDILISEMKEKNGKLSESAQTLYL